MKTLTNKNNPAIRITAPEIVLSADKEEYWIAGIPQRLRTYLAKEWTLVEEEPENSEKQKKPNSELLKEFNKGFWQALMWGKEGYEISPNGKVRALNQNEIDERVDLEKQKEFLHISELCKENANSFTDEDERIRKAIIRSIEEDSSVYEQEVSKEQMLAYLEKQKINTEGDFGRGYDCGYKACLNSHGAEFFEKQKEQKPTGWSEEDEHRRNDAIYFLETAKKHYADTSEIKLTIDWLKSLRPWPYEEKMKNKEKTLTELMDDFEKWLLKPTKPSPHIILTSNPEKMEKLLRKAIKNEIKNQKKDENTDQQG